MAATTDYITKAAPLWTGTVGSGGVADGSVTTVPLASVTGLTNGEVYFATIDRVDSNGTATPSLREVVKGVLSGSNLIDCNRGVEGTAQAHSAGRVVEILFTAAQWNDLGTGLLVQHNEDGTHDNTLVAMLAGTQTFSGTKTFTTAPKKPTSVSIQVVAGTTDLTTGDGKFYFTIPPELNTAVLSSVYAAVITAGTTGTTDIQLHNVTDTVDILSTKLTIDSTETTSATAAAAAVINTSNDDMATNDLIRVDIDAISSTPPKGLVIRLTFSF